MIRANAAARWAWFPDCQHCPPYHLAQEHFPGGIIVNYLSHPGYGRSKCFTPEFLKILSIYKVAICTVSIYGYAVRKIVEEALEAEVADAVGRGYYANGAPPGAGYRNGYRRGRLATAEGPIEYGVRRCTRW